MKKLTFLKKGRDFFDYAQFVKYKSVLNGTVQ